MNAFCICPVYCNCKNPEPKEIKRGVIICLACNKDMLDTREQHDDDNEADYSTCNDTVSDDNFQYEQDREVAQVSNEGGRL